MPVPLYPTCLDVCGCMVALGTREGPVLLFDVGRRHAGAAAPPSSEGRLKPSADVAAAPAGRVPVATATAATAAAAAAAGSSKLVGSTGGSGSGRDTRHGGSPADLANATEGAVSTSTSTNTGGADGNSGNANSSSSVTRVYGSLRDGTGPISAVVLDRAKVIAAGRGSRKSGGGYVVRCGRRGHPWRLGGRHHSCRSLHSVFLAALACVPRDR